jgi:hypothetical protein
MSAYPLEKPASSADELLQWLQVSANCASAGAVSVKKRFAWCSSLAR